MNDKVTQPAASEASYSQAKEPVPDDDAVIIRVCGFALHCAIFLWKKLY